MTDSPKPVRHVRRGFIQAAIWRNPTEKGVYFNVTFERLYRDESNAWKTTHGFGRDDLLLLGKVADLAQNAIFELQEAERSQEGNGDSEHAGGEPAGAGSANDNAAATRRASRRSR